MLKILLIFIKIQTYWGFSFSKIMIINDALRANRKHSMFKILLIFIKIKTYWGLSFNKLMIINDALRPNTTHSNWMNLQNDVN